MYACLSKNGEGKAITERKREGSENKTRETKSERDGARKKETYR